jgi:hypothetical protein
VAFGYIRQILVTRALVDHIGIDDARELLSATPELQLFDRRFSPLRAATTLRSVAGAKAR